MSSLSLAIAVMLFTVTAINDGVEAQGKITVTALPSNQSPKQGEVIEVPMIVDMSQTEFRLGGIVTRLQWDSTKFAFADFAPGATEGFSDPVVNTRKTAEGRLLLASINARGGTAQVNVLTLRLQAKIDITSWSGLQLDLIELTAAESFVNLLPFVEKVITGVKTAKSAADLPTTFALAQNVPNPFNPETIIRYELPKGGEVVLEIYNLTGQKVKTLEDGHKPAGRYAVLWNGKDDRHQNVASGIYFYRIVAQSSEAGKKFVAVKKMSFVR